MQFWKQNDKIFSPCISYGEKLNIESQVFASFSTQRLKKTVVNTREAMNLK